MIIIHAADVHLGSQLGGLEQHDGLPVERIRTAPRVALQRIADLCEERGADLLLIAGDLFDKDSPLALVAEATSTLQRITTAGTRVVLIRGNHDALAKMQRRMPSMAGVDELSTRAAETLLLDELGVAVHGRGFETQHVAENIVATYPQRVEGAFNIGMLHTSLEGSATHAVYAPCHVDDLIAHGYDYWALGHIHQHEIVRAGDPWVVYAGSPQGRHVGEVGDHGVYVLTVEEGALVGAPEHVELATVRWHRETVTAAGPDEDAGELIERAGRQLADIARRHAADVLHVVRLTLEGRCAAHAQLQAEPGRWRDELHLAAASIGEAQVCLERVRLRTSPVLPDAATLREQGDFIGDLARHLATEQLARSGAQGEDTSVRRPAALDRVDDKLRVLADAGAPLRGHAVTSDELDVARDELLARLLVAQHEELEASR